MMFKQLKLLSVLQGIVVTNWVMSQLTKYVESNPPLNITIDNPTFHEPTCRLDDIQEATRSALRNRGV